MFKFIVKHSSSHTIAVKMHPQCTQSIDNNKLIGDKIDYETILDNDNEQSL